MPKTKLQRAKLNKALNNRDTINLSTQVNMPRILEIDELCDYLGIGKNTAYSLLLSGDIESFKIGSVWKIPSYSVNNYIERKCREVQLKKMYNIVNQNRDLFYEENGYIPTIN